MPTLYNCGRGSPVSKIVNSRGSIQRREARQCQGGPLSSRHSGGMSEGRSVWATRIRRSSAALRRPSWRRGSRSILRRQERSIPIAGAQGCYSPPIPLPLQLRGLHRHGDRRSMDNFRMADHTGLIWSNSESRSIRPERLHRSQKRRALAVRRRLWWQPSNWRSTCNLDCMVVDGPAERRKAVRNALELGQHETRSAVTPTLGGTATRFLSEGPRWD